MTPDPRDFSLAYVVAVHTCTYRLQIFYIDIQSDDKQSLSFNACTFAPVENFRYVLLIDEWLVRAIFVVSFHAKRSVP